MNFFNQLLHYLSIPPGNVVYHLVLAFSLVAALMGAIHLWQACQFPQAKRAILGLGILLGLQGVLFFIGFLSSQGFLQAGNILPPLERAVTLLSLVWIAWLWIFPEPAHLADRVTLLLNLLILVFFVLTLVFWSQGDSAAFLNHPTMNLIWQLLSLAFIVFSIVLLVIRRPNAWGFGLAMFILAFAGHMATILLVDNGDFPSAVRLGQIALFPILLTLVQRFPARQASSRLMMDTVKLPLKVEGAENTENGEKHGLLESASLDKYRFSVDPRTFHALLALAAETESDKIGAALIRGVALATLADLSFLVTPIREKDLAITCGYDLIRDEFIDGTSLAEDSVPLLVNSLQRGRPLRLPASSTSSDLKALGQALGLDGAGHLLFIPVISSERGPVGAILLLSPYSNHLWSAEDQGFLNDFAPLFVPILERGQWIAKLELERNSASEQASTIQKKFTDLSADYESAKENASQMQRKADNLTALVSRQEDLQRLVEQLKAENAKLLEFGSSEGISGEQAGQELHLALQANAHLQNAIAEANHKLMEMEKNLASPITSNQAEMISSISRELRQPMSSIIGYADLLLGESVGILGALQRKFIERIKASTERIAGLVDDLIRTNNQEVAHVELKSEAVDLNLIIDNAVAYTSPQIRAKNITLQLDIPEMPAQIQTDREALQQILILLLQNAGAVTPDEGTIALQLKFQKQDEKEYLQIQVTDSGAGITPEDIEHVFQRGYHAAHTQIQGLGDTSVDLNITKSLVDAQNGRIWVNSTPGSGTTFSVLLPFNRTVPHEEA